MAKEINDGADHGKAVFVSGDVSRGKAEIERLFESCIDTALNAFSSPKPLLGWFNNAGVTQDLEPGVDDDLASIGKHAASMFEINVLAPIYALNCCVQHWKKENITDGKVVHNSSIAAGSGVASSGTGPVYSSTKSALDGHTRACASHPGLKRLGVKVSGASKNDRAGTRAW